MVVSAGCLAIILNCYDPQQNADEGTSVKQLYILLFVHVQLPHLTFGFFPLC